MLEIYFAREFNKDFKRISKTGVFKPSLKSVLYPVLDDLRQQKPLAERLRDHPLRGQWHDCRECHVRPDLLLVYRCTTASIQLLRLGSHSEIFG